MRCDLGAANAVDNVVLSKVERNSANLSPSIIFFCVAMVWLLLATFFSNSSMRSSWPTCDRHSLVCFLLLVLFALVSGRVISTESFG